MAVKTLMTAPLQFGRGGEAAETDAMQDGPHRMPPGFNSAAAVKPRRQFSPFERTPPAQRGFNSAAAVKPRRPCRFQEQAGESADASIRPRR